VAADGHPIMQELHCPMTQSDLPAMLQRLRLSTDNSTEFSETWTQGRSAFGGLSAAFAATAMSRDMPADMPLRALMASFIAPLPPGSVQVASHTQRQGKNVTQRSADVISNGAVALQAMGVFGRGRPALRVAADAEFNPAPRDRGLAFDDRDQVKRLPAFLRYFEGCWTGGGRPFSGKPDRQLQLWARHRADMSEFPAERIIAIADIPPPVILSYFDSPPVPASSLTWSLEFLLPPAQIESEWFYLEFTMEAAAEGYTQQSGRIFTEDGRLCAITRQCMVYFGPPPGEA